MAVPSKAKLVSTNGDSDDEDDEEEEAAVTFGNVVIKRCQRSPYFLDPMGNAPPLVEETGSKGIIFPAAPPRKKRFMAAELLKLRQLVRQQNQQLLYSQLYSRTMASTASLTKAMLDQFEAEKRRISTLSDLELEKDHANVDWEAIQEAAFPTRTVSELKSEWKLFCDPSFARGPWTAEEDEALSRAAQARHERNWELIASDLGNRRLPMQYLARYQKVLKPRTFIDDRETTTRAYNIKSNSKSRSGKQAGLHQLLEDATDQQEGTTMAKSGVKWTPEEDEKLTEAVKKFGDKNWQSVATALGGLRSGQQCLHRWQKTLNPNIRRGRWDQSEDNLLTMAIKAYGAGNWRLVQKHVPGRTDVQCRERWVNVLDPSVKSSDGWTAAEEAHLLDVVKSQPAGKWSLVAKVHNDGMLESYQREVTESIEKNTSAPQKPALRTDNQCWRRWKALERVSQKGVFKRPGKNRKLPDWAMHIDDSDEEDQMDSTPRPKRSGAAKASSAKKTTSKAPAKKTAISPEAPPIPSRKTRSQIKATGTPTTTITLESAALRNEDEMDPPSSKKPKLIVRIKRTGDS
jgi:hypothetical protein